MRPEFVIKNILSKEEKYKNNRKFKMRVQQLIVEGWDKSDAQDMAEIELNRGIL